MVQGNCYVGLPDPDVGQSAISEWWVASWLQPWSLSQQCDATKGHVPKNCPSIPVALGP